MVKIHLAAVSLMTIAFASPVWGQGKPPETPVVAPPSAPSFPIYESATTATADNERWAVLGPLGLGVRNVSRPTLTPVLPAPGTATGVAVVVAPGGAFLMLAWEQEGTKVARALANKGISAFILRYRLIPTPLDEAEAGRFIGSRLAQAARPDGNVPVLGTPESTEDGLAALALVRTNAAKWGVDPKRVGMIGFSAGAITTYNTVISAAPGKGPDFFGYIYGPQSVTTVPDNAPPMFDALAFDDEYFPPITFPLVAAWRKAGRPVELHAYGGGGHGFGAGRPGTSTMLVMEEFTAWLSMQGFLKRLDAK